jgi:hypothetical protein
MATQLHLAQAIIHNAVAAANADPEMDISAEQQLVIARRKGGIRPDEPVELYRFEVIRYH